MGNNKGRERSLRGDSEDDSEESKEDLDGHMTDYLFNEKSLNWIEKHFSNSMKFIYSHG